jgi:hypothetical protein
MDGVFNPLTVFLLCIAVAVCVSVICHRVADVKKAKFEHEYRMELLKHEEGTQEK